MLLLLLFLISVIIVSLYIWFSRPNVDKEKRGEEIKEQRRLFQATIEPSDYDYATPEEVFETLDKAGIGSYFLSEEE